MLAASVLTRVATKLGLASVLEVTAEGCESLDLAESDRAQRAGWHGSGVLFTFYLFHAARFSRPRPLGAHLLRGITAPQTLEEGQ